MQEEDRCPLALVEMGELEALKAPVVGCERELREALKKLVRGANCVCHEANAIAQAGVKVA